jgi:hypothetical protein
MNSIPIPNAQPAKNFIKPGLLSTFNGKPPERSTKMIVNAPKRVIPLKRIPTYPPGKFPRGV